jgi:hypothetical protein
MCPPQQPALAELFTASFPERSSALGQMYHPQAKKKDAVDDDAISEIL